MSLTTIGSSAVDHPKVTLEEDLDAIKKTASDAVDSSASTTAVLNVQVPKVRKINGIPLTGDVELTDTVLDIYTKKVIDTKLGAIVSTGYNPVYLNGHLLDRDVTLTAGDVGSYSNPEITEKRAAFIPPTRKIANKPLSADVNVTAADINAYTKAQIDAKITGVLPTRTINKVPLATNIVLTPGDIGAPAVDDVVPRTFKVNGVVLAGSGITLSGASGSYTKAEFDALLTGYLPLVNKWGLGMRAIPQTSPESGFYSYTTGGPAGSSAGVKIVAGKGTLAFPSDLPEVWYSKDSTTFTQIRSGRAAPLPNYWAPLKDSLAIITGEGPLDKLTVNGSAVELTSRSVQFSRASTATYIGRDGTLKNAAVNEPRFEKDGLLIECQATNLVPYSGVYNETGTFWQMNHWTAATKPTITVVDGDHFKVATPAEYGNGVWLSSAKLGVASGKTYTVSFDIQVLSGLIFCGFEKGPNIPLRPEDTPTMKRITVTATMGAVSNIVFYSGTYRLYDDVASTFIIGRVQVEEGSVQTSYIPTSGTAATRAADIVSIPEALNVRAQGDMTVAATLGSWSSSKSLPTILSGNQYGFIYQDSVNKDISYKSFDNSIVLLKGATEMVSGVLATRVDTKNATVSVLANGGILTGDYTKTRPFYGSSDKLYLSTPNPATWAVNPENKIKIMHMSNVRIWHRALADDQMRGLS